mmetsp:Transcript_5496/g.8473  ORF Transcript_5496/g.8473 Transcript_5496/m.8473 type:complete len:163 (+) Transcript_5496:93-581(+)|eukprot:CAMPEP_0118681096 /NCGR_PEP_ID=MMETSP0800-20121206/4744_1 /TAXON_ID=210618 ORGANISM="Striatella unipunctata, Strain CCMP2910" /NCGR_SAMPLE_ID=MMETSP0800 /ASSEMBLY_ACC=CAM_ASM_000638 /LENGTH=162 /DNA_ID=CAMNT_0006577345 /DNA_START=79 /DNA_END=567 /DNA_ORIENTATION=-
MNKTFTLICLLIILVATQASEVAIREDDAALFSKIAELMDESEEKGITGERGLQVCYPFCGPLILLFYFLLGLVPDRCSSFVSIFEFIDDIADLSQYPRLCPAQFIFNPECEMSRVEEQSLRICGVIIGFPATVLEVLTPIESVCTDFCYQVYDTYCATCSL